MTTKPCVNLSTMLPSNPVASRSLPQLFLSKWFKWFIFVGSIFFFFFSLPWLCWNGCSRSLKCVFDHISGLLVILILFMFSIVFDSASINICFQVFWGSSNLLEYSPPHSMSSPTHSNLLNCCFHGNYSNLFSLLACLQPYLLSFTLQVGPFHMAQDQMKWPSLNLSCKLPVSLHDLKQLTLLVSSKFSFPMSKS